MTTNTTPATTPDGLPTATESTDLGNARLLVHKHGIDLRYCYSHNQWFLWDGKRYRLDETNEIMRRAKTVTDYLLNLAASVDDNDRSAKHKLTKWALDTQSDRRLKAMIDLAKSEPRVAVTPDQFDTDPWLLTCENGTLDLRTGELLAHDRANLCTKLVPIHYDSDAGCPQFLAFLHTIMAGKRDLIAYIQRAIGYTLTGVTRERCMFIAHGGGTNGKSTLLNILYALTTRCITGGRAEAFTAYGNRNAGP